uniref:Uncharacterized protein n=1 Tax=Trichobilharzia regenti TaxID=157069 RepID=A0AA85J3H8_TRIRE|nr:unnamed protein product [Trichobilharzia regenti]
MCAATLPTLQRAYSRPMLPSKFIVLSLTLTGVIRFVKIVKERLSVNIGLLVLCVLLLSCGITEYLLLKYVNLSIFLNLYFRRIDALFDK